MNYKTWKIFLIWWGAIKNWETDFIEKEILSSVNKSEINILMINYANSIENDTKYTDKFINAYSNYDMYNIYFNQLNFEESFTEEIVNDKLNKADVIYFWWWNTIKLKESLDKNKLFDLILKKYLYNNKIIAWRSAWALIFFERFLSEKSIDNSEIGVFDWYWLLKWLCSVHLTEFKEWPILEKFVLETWVNWVWMDECTCLVIKDWQFSTIKKDWKGIYKYSHLYWSINIEDIFTDKFIDTNFLYY